MDGASATQRGSGSGETSLPEAAALAREPGVAAASAFTTDAGSVKLARTPLSVLPLPLRPADSAFSPAASATTGADADAAAVSTAEARTRG